MQDRRQGTHYDSLVSSKCGPLSTQAEVRHIAHFLFSLLHGSEQLSSAVFSAEQAMH
jgi:hypothetical protein